MPARFSDVVRALKELGVTVEKPKKGSHWKATKDGVMYPIPAHNGEKSELDDVYVKGVCRAFGIDAKTFKEKL